MAEQIPLFDAGGESDGVEKIVVKPAPEAVFFVQNFKKKCPAIVTHGGKTGKTMP
jgi:hypothetical protein